jgi:hypothetical protein
MAEKFNMVDYLAKHATVWIAKGIKLAGVFFEFWISEVNFVPK